LTTVMEPYDVSANSSAGAFSFNDSTTDELTVDTVAPVPTITLNAIATDNVINVAEAASPFDITGTVAGEFNTGDTVTLTVNGSNYMGAVNAAGQFRVFPAQTPQAISVTQAPQQTTQWISLPLLLC